MSCGARPLKTPQHLISMNSKHVLVLEGRYCITYLFSVFTSLPTRVQQMNVSYKEQDSYYTTDKGSRMFRRCLVLKTPVRKKSDTVT